MRLLLWSVMLLALAACGATGPLSKAPDARLANEIEAKLRTVPCVGSMNRWERHYTFSSKPSLRAAAMTFGSSNRWFNYNVIDIAFYQAGFEEYREGRYLGDSRLPGADDRQYDLVFGHYDIPTHTASLWACGPNVGGAPDVNIVVR